MGFFDIFKKKPPTHSEKVDLAYRCYNQNMVGTVFPGGRTQASNIIVSLAKIYGVNLDDCSAKEYHSILTTFSDVLIRRTITQSSDEHIVVSLQVKHGDYIKDKTIAEKVLAYCKLNMDNPNFVLDSADKMELIEGCSGEMTEDEKLAVQNTDIQDASVEDPDYGICMEKPIYTNGPEDTDSFLNSLKSTLGESLVWEKQETLDVDGVAGKVIVYSSSLPSGRSYKTLYVNEHGINAERKTPKGFTVQKEKPVSSPTTKEEGYYFENPMELAIYGKLHGKGSFVSWISSDKYLELYKKGYQLFECGQYAKAIDVYKECLKLNPIGISARFELVECYIVTKQLAFARKSLYDMKDYLMEDSHKAKFYRRIGYIAIEEGSYKEAYACYQYSLNYENHPSVSQEMQYIASKAGSSVKKVSAESTLDAYNIPRI